MNKINKYLHGLTSTQRRDVEYSTSLIITLKPVHDC